MTLEKIYSMGLINDSTEVWIRNADMHVLAYGNRHYDSILNHIYSEIEDFAWQDDNKIFINLKE